MCNLPFLRGRRFTSHNAAPVENEVQVTESNANSTCRIVGTVSFAGEVHRKNIRMSEGFCESCHPEGLPDPTLIVAADGGLKNVFVYIASTVPGEFGPPGEALHITQRGCGFVPRVSGAMMGQTIVIDNEDDTLHNVHFLGRLVSEFTASQRKGEEHRVTVRRPDVIGMFFCDLHGWMKCYVGGLKHPFFAVTNNSGKYDLGAAAALVPGEYEVAVWHEACASQAQIVRITAGETATINFVLTTK